MPIYGKTYVVFYEFINFKRKKVLFGHFFTHSNIAVQTRIQTLGLGGLEPKNLIKNFVQIFFSSNLGHFLLKIQPFWPKYYIFPPNFLPFGGGLEPGIHSLFGVWGGSSPGAPPLYTLLHPPVTVGQISGFSSSFYIPLYKSFQKRCFHIGVTVQLCWKRHGNRKFT